MRKSAFTFDHSISIGFISGLYGGRYELFLLELTTGMRRGEILALKWRDLNLKTGELHISRQVLKVNGKVLISTPKTKSSNRMILLLPEMLELLAELKTRTDSEWIFPSPLDLTQPRHPAAVYGSIIANMRWVEIIPGVTGHQQSKR